MIPPWHPSDASQTCVRQNIAGVSYEEYTCLYPTVRPLYLEWETNYDPVPVRDWMMEHPLVPITACLLYGALILVGQGYFRKRDRYHWKWTLAAWNFGLATFSAVGFTRTAPWLLHMMQQYTSDEILCFDPEASYGSGSTGLWVQLFVLSKFPELLDTFFIVIHKKKLILLHWYHHVSVLLYCWHSYVYKAPLGILFCVMNYGVHSIMYFYYGLMALRLKPKWFNPMIITGAQISQMVVGVISTAMANYLFFVKLNTETDTCFMSTENNVAALVMYGSYLLLFVQFFFGRYFIRSNNRKNTKTAANGKKVN